MGVENIIAGNGFWIALAGMSVVFGGLVLVALYVALLPKLFEWTAGAGRAGRAARAARKSAPRVQAADAAVMEQETSLGIDPDLLAAIGYVMQAERERQLAQDHQRITLRDDEEQRVWTAIGKMRTLSTRM